MHAAVTNFLHHHRFSERSQIFVANGLKMFGVSIFSIFAPIYLFRLGYDLHTILLFFVLDFGLRMVWQPFAGWFTAKYGSKHALIVSAGGTITTLLLLYSLPSMHWPLLLIAAVNGFANVFHFLGYFVNFTGTQNVTQSGKSTGVMAQLVIVATSLGPLVGGIIADTAGASWALIAAVAVVIASLYPLLTSADVVERHRFDLRQLDIRGMRGDLVSQVGKAWDNRSAMIIWPFFLFFIVDNYRDVGLIATLSFLAVMATAYLATQFVDKLEVPMLISGSTISAIFHLLRGFVTSLGGAIWLNMADGVVNWVSQIPWQAEMYRHAKSQSPVEYFALSNFTSDASSTVYFVILLLVSRFVDQQQMFSIAFVIGAVGVLLAPSIIRRRVMQPAAVPSAD